MSSCLRLSRRLKGGSLVSYIAAGSPAAFLILAMGILLESEIVRVWGWGWVSLLLWDAAFLWGAVFFRSTFWRIESCRRSPRRKYLQRLRLRRKAGSGCRPFPLLILVSRCFVWMYQCFAEVERQRQARQGWEYVEQGVHIDEEQQTGVGTHPVCDVRQEFVRIYEFYHVAEGQSVVDIQIDGPFCRVAGDGCENRPDLSLADAVEYGKTCSDVEGYRDNAPTKGESQYGDPGELVGYFCDYQI